MFFKLTPKSLKAKNRVEEAGKPSQWLLLEKRYNVAFSDRSGPWLYLMLDVPNGREYARWVHHLEDPHFKVEHVTT